MRAADRKPHVPENELETRSNEVMKKYQRWVALAMAAVLTATSLPQTAFAETASEEVIETEAVFDAEDTEAGMTEETEETEATESTEAGETEATENTEAGETEATENTEAGETEETEATEAAEAAESTEISETESTETEVIEETESTETGSTETEAVEETESTEIVEVTPEDDDKFARPCIALEDGVEVRQPEGDYMLYSFSPKKDGWYRIKGESLNGQKMYVDPEKTVYYTKDSNGKSVENVSSISAGLFEVGTKVERMVYLRADEQYYFYCGQEGSNPTATLDYKVQVKQVDVDHIEVIQAPTERSCGYIDFTGLKVKVWYTDGSSYISDISAKNNYSGESYFYMDIFDWSRLFVEQQKGAHTLDFKVQTASVDGKAWSANGGDGEFSALKDGTHTVNCILGEYILNNNNSNPDDGTLKKAKEYAFSFPITVAKNNIASIEVLDAKTEFTQGYNEYLSDIQLKITYNDGTPEKVATFDMPSPKDTNCRAYLKYKKNGKEDTIASIDYWLKYGGKLGKATAYVTYGNASTTYEITISENPYQKLEVTPERTVLYTGCSYSAGTMQNYGDKVTVAASPVTFYRKDGTTESYASCYQVPEYWKAHIEYGLDLNGTSYGYVDSYIKAGGKTGTATAYMKMKGVEATWQVEIKKNPYDHIRIVTKPVKTQYVSNSSSALDLKGLVFYAYKDKTETSNNYDIYSYDEYVKAGNGYFTGSMTEEKYDLMKRMFGTYLGEDEYIKYLDNGKHEVAVYFMGHKAAYEIEVADKFANALTIDKLPDKTVGYVGQSSHTVSDYGLEFTITTAGNSKKYRAYKNGVEGYADWNDIKSEVTVDTSKINWNTPGVYNVTVSYKGVSDTYAYTVEESPVKELQLEGNLKRKEVYVYETEGKLADLAGLTVKILFSDGTSKKVNLGETLDIFYYNGVDFYLEKEWKQKTGTSATLGENAVIISTCGISVETEAITVKSNPVKSIGVTKNPDNIQGWGKVDLYGLSLKVTYADGKAETLKITEHNSEVEAANSLGGAISGEFIYNSGKAYEKIKLTYQNAFCTITTDSDISNAKSTALTNESSFTVSLSRSDSVKVYSFKPSKTADYTFGLESNKEENIRIDLYNAQKVRLDYGVGYKTNVQANLQKGSTYYIVVYKNDWNDTVHTLDCYLSSTYETFSEVAVKSIKVTKPVKTTWYDFESTGNIYIGSGGVSLEGTEYEITYANGWKKTETVSSSSSKVQIGDNTLSASWKYTDGNYISKRNDNVLTYTWGIQTFPFTGTFGKTTPVKAITVTENPWKTAPAYEYEVENSWDFPSPRGLKLKIAYSDGRTADEVVWDNDDSTYELNGYTIELAHKGDGLAGGNNTVVASYMGKSTEFSMEVQKNPVSEIKVLKLPEKQEYYPFDDYVDLYGAKLQFIYRDGTKKTVTVDEHCTAIYPDETYGQRADAGIATRQNTDGAKYRAVTLSYMDIRADILRCREKNLAAEDAQEIAEGDTNEVNLGSGGYIIYRLTVPVQKKYQFTSMKETSNGGTTADSATLFVYREDGTELKSGYRQVELTLAPGTYYFAVKIYNSVSAHKSIIHVEAEAVTEEPEKTTNVTLDYSSAGKNFTYGDGTWSVTAQIKENGSAVTRSVQWEYPNTDAFDFKISSNQKTLSVTPKRATTENESFQITAKDTVSGKKVSVSLKTARAAIDKTDADGKSIYTVSAVLDQEWTGKQVCPSVTVKNEATGKTLGSADYEVAYKDNVNVGKATVVVTGKGNYTGTLTQYFWIKEQTKPEPEPDTEQDTEQSTEQKPEQKPEQDTEQKPEQKPEQNTEKKNPNLKVSKTSYKKVYGDKAFSLKASSNCKITYKSSNTKVATVKNGKVTLKKCGKATITLTTGGGNYKKQTKKVTITVVPKQASVKKVTSKKAAQLTVSWKKQTEASGYVVEYTTDKNFKKGVKKVTISKNKTTGTTIKKLKKGKKYYVRVKPYTTIDKKKVYGKTSKTVKATTKKK